MNLFLQAVAVAPLLARIGLRTSRAKAWRWINVTGGDSVFERSETTGRIWSVELP